MREDQLKILRHMLGINDPFSKEPKPYRDYYCANKGDAELCALAKIGMVKIYRTDERYDWYKTTREGRRLAMNSHRSIRKTKSQRVYAKFLDIRDAFNDLTFRDFLTSPQFHRARIEA